MGNPYTTPLSQKSSKFDLQIHHIVVLFICEHNIRDWIYLSQAGLNVLPQTYYPRDDAGLFAQAMNADLAKCKVFVQLLGAFAGRKQPAAPKGYPGLQPSLPKEPRFLFCNGAAGTSM